MLKKFSNQEAFELIKALILSRQIVVAGPAEMGSDEACQFDLAAHDSLYLKALYFQLTHHESGLTEVAALEETLREDPEAPCHSAD